MSIGDSFFNYVSDREAPLVVVNITHTDKYEDMRFSKHHIVWHKKTYMTLSRTKAFLRELSQEPPVAYGFVKYAIIVEF